jgi:hypothetical protein
MHNSQQHALGRWKAGAFALALLAVAGGATAGQSGKEEAGLAGVQAHVDGAGQLRQPSAAEIKAYADAVRTLFATRSAAAAQVVQHGDGSVSATLGPESLNVWVATIGADGALHQVCVEGANAAGAVQGAPALEVK